MPRYLGTCHCGAVRFEVETVIDRVTQCNCSICLKKGILHHRVSQERFRLLSSQSDLCTYQFWTRAAKHHFCKICGIHTFTRPRAAPELYTINVRTLDNFDLEHERPEVVTFDGQHWEASMEALNR